MFYLPFKLRSQTSYTVPKGPNFKWASVVKTCINGTHISLTTPSSRKVFEEEPVTPRKTIFLRNNDFKPDNLDNREWEYFTVIARSWSFNGPWFTGQAGALRLHVSVMRRLNHNPQVSYFHPRAFEATIADLMHFYHAGSPHYNKKIQRWYVPVDWTPLKNFPSVAAKFDAVRNPDVGRPERYRYLFMPISDEYLLQVSMPITRVLPFIRSSAIPEDDTDKWISEEPMKELADQILNSLQVRLSPEAEQQQAKALERLSLEERVLVKEFPPLKWV
jgi:hypothetical protein